MYAAGFNNIQHTRIWRNYLHNVRSAPHNILINRRIWGVNKSGLFFYFFLFVIYRAVCEIILSYACVLTRWQRASDQRDTVWRRGEERRGISRWMRMDDSDCIWSKWAAVRIGSSAAAVDSELSGRVHLEDCDGLSSLLASAVETHPCDCYWALYALHGEVWLLLCSRSQHCTSLFFFLMVLMTLIPSLSNFYSNL